MYFGFLRGLGNLQSFDQTADAFGSQLVENRVGLFGQDADAVGGGLSNCAGLVAGEPEQSFAKVRPLVRNKLDAQILDHVIDHEDAELVHFVGLVVLKRSAENVGVQQLDYAERELLVGFEEDAHQIAQSDVERVLVQVRVLEVVQLLRFEVFFTPLLVVLLPVLTFLHNVEHFLSHLLDLHSL